MRRISFGYVSNSAEDLHLCRFDHGVYAAEGDAVALKRITLGSLRDGGLRPTASAAVVLKRMKHDEEDSFLVASEWL